MYLGVTGVEVLRSNGIRSQLLGLAVQRPESEVVGSEHDSAVGGEKHGHAIKVAFVVHHLAHGVGAALIDEHSVVRRGHIDFSPLLVFEEAHDKTLGQDFLCRGCYLNVQLFDVLSIDSRETMVDVVGPDDALGIDEHSIKVGISNDLVDFECGLRIGLTSFDIHHKNAQSIGRNDDKILLWKVEHLCDRIAQLRFVGSELDAREMVGGNVVLEEPRIGHNHEVMLIHLSNGLGLVEEQLASDRVGIVDGVEQVPIEEFERLGRGNPQHIGAIHVERPDVTALQALLQGVEPCHLRLR